MKNKKKTKGRIWFYSVILILFLSALWFFIPVTETVTLNLDKVEGASAKFALITDLHCCYYGKDMKTLLKMIDKEKPDAVLLSGDIFDHQKRFENSKVFCEAIVKKYPCFYVIGNHEHWSDRQDEIKDYLRDIGVNVLEGDCKEITLNGIDFDICGIDDPDSLSDSAWKNQLNRAYEACDDEHVSILLSHRPERTEDYETVGFDIIAAGHAHCGQFRVPFVNRGLFVPSQGVFAKYVNGAYDLSNGSKLVVSRGLARESTPLPRYFNHPEVLMIVVE